MEQRPPILQTFFNVCALSGLILAVRTEVVSSKPTIENLISYLYTSALIIPRVLLIAATVIIVEIFYKKYVEPKIFKDDKPD